MLNGRIGSTLLLVQRQAILVQVKLSQSPSHVPRIFENFRTSGRPASGQASHAGRANHRCVKSASGR
jgi:hypothetical protein